MRLSTLTLAAAAAAVLVLGSGCAAPGSTTAGSRSSDVVATVTGSLTSVAPLTTADGSTTGSSGPSSTQQSTSPTTGSPVRATSAPLPGCTPDTLRTRTDGTLTFATSARPTAPWFVGAPSDGQGFEAAVAVAVAHRLGYDSADVRWVTADRAAVLAGHATGFDAFIDLVPIPDQPPAAVQFSTGYLDNSAVLLAPEGSALSGISSVSELSGHRIGKLGGVTVPGAGTSVPTASVAISRIGAHTLDGVVATVADAAALVGRSGLQPVAIVPPPSGQQARQFGLVLPKASTVAPCVSAALDVLRVEGDLTTVAEDWLPAAAAPLLNAG